MLWSPKGPVRFGKIAVPERDREGAGAVNSKGWVLNRVSIQRLRQSSC